jgi:hypothetical protein
MDYRIRPSTTVYVRGDVEQWVNGYIVIAVEPSNAEALNTGHRERCDSMSLAVHLDHLVFGIVDHCDRVGIGSAGDIQDAIADRRGHVTKQCTSFENFELHSPAASMPGSADLTCHDHAPNWNKGNATSATE